MGDATRRDALARALCARICDDHRSIDDLVDLDRYLSSLAADHERDGREAREAREAMVALRSVACRLGPAWPEFQFVVGLLNCLVLRLERARVDRGLLELVEAAS